MTTLEAIGFNAAAGASLGVLGLLGFGYAVVNRHEFIAPRCAARPKNTIYNPHPSDPEQDRGTPMLGWIPWTLSLSYDDLMSGIKGTGTRQNGMSGSLLKCNLDGIVLLRFHALGLKLSALTTVICILIIFPMYWTADCSELASSSGEWNEACATESYNLTNYERTTIANVPSTSISESNGIGGTVPDNDASRAAQIRLYFVAICFLFIQAYFLHLLKREWIEILAMRRVYYLEANIFKDRQNELHTIQQAAKQEEAERAHSKRAFFLQDEEAENETRLRIRDPWISDPEQRETVPPIQLYSLLVGGLPSLPDNENQSEANNKRQAIDWQISLTAAFFDHCVPNQPGFSSSVAAVTILPSSKAIALAWRKWYTAASKLRRLRFIRAQLAMKLHKELMGQEVYNLDGDDVVSGNSGPIVHLDDSVVKSKQSGDEEKSNIADDYGPDLSTRDGFASSVRQQAEQKRAVSTSSTTTMLRQRPPDRTPQNDSDNTYKSQLRNYFEAVLQDQEHDMVVPQAGASVAFRGASKRNLLDRLAYDDEDDDLGIAEEDLHALLVNTFGPEQTSVYSREFAQSAAPCCPNGCNEAKVMLADIETLKEMEREAAHAVLEANHELWKQQQRAREAHHLIPDEAGNSTNLEEGGVVEQPVPEGTNEFSSEAAEFDIEAGKGTTGLRERKTSERATIKLPKDMQLEGKLWAQKQSEEYVSDDIEISYDQDEDLIDPLHSASRSIKTMSNWERVKLIAQTMTLSENPKGKYKKDGGVISGKWTRPRLKDILSSTRKAIETTEGLVTQTQEYLDLTRESSYAVVTFTSRQAAVAARHCLTDARAADRWLTVHELPIPPLADSAACDICVCRNCCRPVTLSIHDRQKKWRHYFVLLTLGAFYTLMVFPISFVASLMEPATFAEVFPNLFEWLEETSEGITAHITGFLQGMVWTVFFHLCPTVFKLLANFGSNATSVANAELKALQYYWWFMMVVAFTGTLIANMLLFGFGDGGFGSSVQILFGTLARSIPSTVSASWLNWIVLRSTFTLTCFYLLRFNSFMFDFCGMKCCSRLDRGGGSGPPIPYRLYVDSGVVVMSLVALAPASPLIAPACLIYFLWCQPLLRRCLIFVYRPRFDGGGLRWPFMFTMCIASLILGQILLTIQMVFKQAPGPACLCALPIIITYLAYRNLREKYEEPFQDAALLQTALLDGWDVTEESSSEKREKLRKWLVDAHKASYVPVCLAGGDAKESSLTAEPAVVVPVDTDLKVDVLEDASSRAASVKIIDSDLVDLRRKAYQQGRMQSGAILRRAAQSLSVVQPDRATKQQSLSVCSQENASDEF